MSRPVSESKSFNYLPVSKEAQKYRGLTPAQEKKANIATISGIAFGVVLLTGAIIVASLYLTNSIPISGDVFAFGSLMGGSVSIPLIVASIFLRYGDGYGDEINKKQIVKDLNSESLQSLRNSLFFQIIPLVRNGILTIEESRKLENLFQRLGDQLRQKWELKYNNSLDENMLNEKEEKIDDKIDDLEFEWEQLRWDLQILRNNEEDLLPASLRTFRVGLHKLTEISFQDLKQDQNRYLAFFTNEEKQAFIELNNAPEWEAMRPTLSVFKDYFHLLLSKEEAREWKIKRSLELGSVRDLYQMSKEDKSFLSKAKQHLNQSQLALLVKCLGQIEIFCQNQPNTNESSSFAMESEDAIQSEWEKGRPQGITDIDRKLKEIFQCVKLKQAMTNCFDSAFQLFNAI